MIQDLLRHKANPNLKNNVSTFVLMADRTLRKLSYCDHASQIGSTPLHYLCQNYTVSVDKLQAVMQSKQVNVTLTNSVCSKVLSGSLILST